jgi:hypothetical protein
MATIKKCDKCNREVESKDLAKNVYTHRVWVRSVELCEDCAQPLLAILIAEYKCFSSCPSEGLAMDGSKH